MPERFVPTYLDRTTPVGTGRTVTSVTAEDPPPLALTLTEPVRSGDSSPEELTVAMLGSALTQVRMTPETGFPLLSVTFATNWTAVPTTASVVGDSVTITDLLG
jgi:hypothetical protein